MKKDTVGMIVRLALVLLLMCFLLLPLILGVSNAFKPEGEINSLSPTLIPKHPTFENLKVLLSDQRFLIGLRNSAIIGILTMITSLCISMPVAYVLARFKGRLSPIFQGWIVLSQMIPVITLVVPIYLILKALHLTDNLVGLLITYTIWSIPPALWLLKGFISGLPSAIEEAAAIDGCGIIGIFFRVIIPNILPGVMTAGVFAFIGAWNEYFFATCFIKSTANTTLALILGTYVGITGSLRVGTMCAGAIVSAIPGLILFAIFQKYYVNGATLGAVK